MSEAWPTGPEQPTLAVGEVHVWRAEVDGPCPGLEGLPLPERERAAAFLREDAASRWVASRWALRQVLSRYRDEPPAEISLEPDKNGKPQLTELHQLDHPADSQVDAVRNRTSDLRFNLSHSSDLALIAIAQGREVGVDVEEIEPGRDLLAIAERALSPEVAAAIRTAPPADQTAAFYRAWTRHEARLKCLGIGLASHRFHPSPRYSEDKGGNDERGAVAVADLEVGPGYAAAVAVPGPDLGTLRCFTIPF